MANKTFAVPLKAKRTDFSLKRMNGGWNGPHHPLVVHSRYRTLRLGGRNEL